MGRSIKMSIGEDYSRYWAVIPLPATGDPMDFQCTMCRQRRHTISMELIQYGFVADKHTYFLVCLDCGFTHAVEQNMDIEEN